MATTINLVGDSFGIVLSCFEKQRLPSKACSTPSPCHRRLCARPSLVTSFGCSDTGRSGNSSKPSSLS